MVWKAEIRKMYLFIVTWKHAFPSKTHIEGFLKGYNRNPFSVRKRKYSVQKKYQWSFLLIIEIKQPLFKLCRFCNESSIDKKVR